MNEQEIAEQVKKRAEELLGHKEAEPLDEAFIYKCLDANERGDGVLYATLNRDEFLYNTTPKDGEWMVWKGNVWDLDTSRRSLDAVEKCALEYQAVYEKLKEEVAKEGIDKEHPDAWKITLRDEYRKRVRKLRSKNGACNALFWAPAVDPSMCCKEDDFDKMPWLLPVKNGVINLKTGVLEAGRQEDRLCRALNVDYDPRADYSMWQDVVDEITFDYGISDFLKRSFGCAITGLSSEQYIWVFVGPGRNGKGIIFNLIGDVLGPYYHEINRGMLLEQRNEPTLGAASEHKYSLFCKRLAVGAETNKGQKIDAGAVKGLTGEDNVTCRPLFKSELSFFPTHNLFLHTNHIPYGLTSDFSLVQRLLLIEFPHMYVDDIEAETKKWPAKANRFRKKDPKLKEKLRLCKKGILRWLVEGCLEWQETGLKPPQSILDSVNKHTRDEDYIGQFLEACLVHYPDEDKTRIPCTRMYEAFRWWWSSNMGGSEQRIPAMKTINASIRDRGHIVDQSGGKTWIYKHDLNEEIVADVDAFVLKGCKS